MKRIEDYLPIVGDNVMYDIYQKAAKLYERRLLHVNSTFIGGGVAEILNNLVPLMNDIGLDAGWRVLHGTGDHRRRYRLSYFRQLCPGCHLRSHPDSFCWGIRQQVASPPDST